MLKAHFISPLMLWHAPLACSAAWGDLYYFGSQSSPYDSCPAPELLYPLREVGGCVAIGAGNGFSVFATGLQTARSDEFTLALMSALFSNRFG